MRGLISLRTFSVKLLVLMLTSYLMVCHHLACTMHTASTLHAEFKHGLDRIKKSGISSQVFVGFGFGCMNNSQYFVCEIGEEEALKFITHMLFSEQTNSFHCIRASKWGIRYTHKNFIKQLSLYNVGDIRNWNKSFSFLWYG